MKWLAPNEPETETSNIVCSVVRPDLAPGFGRVWRNQGRGRSGVLQARAPPRNDAKNRTATPRANGNSRTSRRETTICYSYVHLPAYILIPGGLKIREVGTRETGMTLLQGAIAANRFGLGARPGEIQAASSDPRGWLKAQIRPDAAIIPADGLMSVEQVFEERRDAYADMAATGGLRPGAGKRAAAANKPADGDNANAQKAGAGTTTAQQEVRKMVQRESRDGLQKEIEARSRFAASTQSPFAERWVRFWSNHFTVAARNAQLIGIVGPFERDAIRANAFGSFAGLLGNATFHPTMLIYLDSNR